MSRDGTNGEVPTREGESEVLPERREPLSTWVKVFLLVEGGAAAIGLVTPITPSKTGSDKDLAEWFLDDPSYLQKALVDFALVNVLLVVLALFFWGYLLWQKRGGEPDRS